MLRRVVKSRGRARSSTLDPLAWCRLVSTCFPLLGPAYFVVGRVLEVLEGRDLDDLGFLGVLGGWRGRGSCHRGSRSGGLGREGRLAKFHTGWRLARPWLVNPWLVTSRAPHASRRLARALTGLRACLCAAWRRSRLALGCSGSASQLCFSPSVWSLARRFCVHDAVAPFVALAGSAVCRLPSQGAKAVLFDEATGRRDEQHGWRLELQGRRRAFSRVPPGW